MTKISVNKIQLEYDTFGNPDDPALLLIMGLGSQMILWDEAFCRNLAEQGLYIIRFDNRDVGLSSKFDDAGTPDLMEIVASMMRGEVPNIPYTLDDMARDAVELLKTLKIEKAHICGVSLGAAIAQAIAINHPSAIRSLISIYGSTGNPALPQPKPEMLALLMTPAPQNRDEAIEQTFNTYEAIYGPKFDFDKEWHLEMIKQAYDRCFCPQGKVRQLAAVTAHGNRKEALRRLDVPALVIHGTDDPLIPMEGGVDTAEAIMGSDLMLIEGMGHDLPNGKGAWPQISEAMVKHIKKIETP